MLTALQDQLTSGPLADLKAGTVTGDEFVTEAQSLVASYDANVDQQLLPHFKNIDLLLKIQGQRSVADLASLNQQNTVGLIDSTQFETQSQTAINSLTSGPIHSLDTPVSAYVSTTQAFETELKTLASSLSTSATHRYDRRHEHHAPGGGGSLPRRHERGALRHASEHLQSGRRRGDDPGRRGDHDRRERQPHRRDRAECCHHGL